ncbi:hypothetical protein [Kribbella sp. CA-294648]|uniref:hypothetical protein n=1 Tax=Kribbella sp. CA-294648 TaxID=3239948 RepID=UPI003D9351BE
MAISLIAIVELPTPGMVSLACLQDLTAVRVRASSAVTAAGEPIASSVSSKNGPF